MVEIIWNDANFDHMFHSWSGPTGHYIKDRVKTLEMLARAQAGVRTGALKSSIESMFGRRGKSLRAKVGANVRLPDTARNRGYAYWHHEGTKPHKIEAKWAKALRYHSATAGIVYAHSVHHPGTSPNPYLTQPMREVF